MCASVAEKLAKNEAFALEQGFVMRLVTTATLKVV